ncbi:hypothetical protein B6A10_05975 [Flavobacterium sp. L1I52]|uniref:Uncharacterized protein n=1 Tax=Flavobacterium pokkalii TaxID=1940408 RepID=A0ABR7UPE8_9FLAO|nr:hypothetical protein [Flavobacterium pokkalii]MBD0724721.1 hypothetical protein [Flavobacterium pokkalii]
MKKILFTLYLCTIQLGFAQLSTKVVDRFPAHILHNVYELHNTIPLTESQQIQLAERLLRNDSIANANKKILTHEKLKHLCSLNKSTAEDVLEENQFNIFLYHEDKSNRLLLALVKATQLKLNKEQYTAIRKELTKLENPNGKKPEKRIPYYRQKLDSILDKKQHGMLTYYVYIEESKTQTNLEWQEINQLQLIKNKDPKKAYNELLNYNTARNVFLDEAAEKIPSRVITEVKQKFITDRQPLFLMHKNIVANNEYKNNLFAIAIRNEKQLELTAPQVDSLLVKCKAVEQMKNEQKTNAPIGLFPFVNKNITQILTPKQMQMVLAKKYEAQANSYALESWKTIEQQNWTAGLDKNQTIKDFRIYKLKSLVANEIVKMNNNQSNLFARRDIESKKPEPLKKLDELKAAENNTKSTKNALKW